MKRIALIIAGVLVFQLAQSQNLQVPEVTAEQKQEVLYMHVIAYCVTGIAYAKTQGDSPEDYGRYVGKLFATMWDPATSFDMFAGRLMFMLAGMHPGNEMKIMEQEEGMVRFQMKNTDLSFKQGPMFEVSYEDFLDCSYGILDELGTYLNVGFSHQLVDDGWYEITLKAQ